MELINKVKNYNISFSQFSIFSFIIIIGFALIPLFINFPYRINIFLSWEGAYRISEGQIPFKDFGLPLGFGYWLIPALFFKIFGPYLITLVKAQVFINIIAGLTFYNILRVLKVAPGIIFLSILLFCLSYSFVNFWPWYNHLVFVYQLLSINFLLLGYFHTPGKTRPFIYLFLSAFFIFLSLFTKQDGGALAFMVNFFAILYISFANRSYEKLIFYYVSFLIISAIIILPFLQYDFLYWLNYGQEPHNSRIQLLDILNNIFFRSQWIKFYFLIVGIILVSRANNIKALLNNKIFVTSTLLVIGILVQASIVQTTSYIPHNVNIYFHSFAFAYLLAYLPLKINYNKFPVVILFILLIFFWWSSDYWNYGKRIITKIVPSLTQNGSNNSVSINTWITTPDTVKTSRDDWRVYNSKAFQNILMPPSTIKGIKYIKDLAVVKNKEDLKVLNMSELTPLAYELDYELETGPGIPLWYHKNVAIFDVQIDDYCKKIEAGYYDLVLFEHINYLNNFYPEEIRNCLKKHYEMDHKFLAPREIQNSYIEIYLKRQSEEQMNYL